VAHRSSWRSHASAVDRARYDARRMSQGAANLVVLVLPDQPIRPSHLAVRQHKASFASLLGACTIECFGYR
jgi:hypothetical protein